MPGRVLLEGHRQIAERPAGRWRDAHQLHHQHSVDEVGRVGRSVDCGHRDRAQELEQDAVLVSPQLALGEAAARHRPAERVSHASGDPARVVEHREGVLIERKRELVFVGWERQPRSD